MSSTSDPERPATERQRAFAVHLGIKLPNECTVTEASEFIDAALASQKDEITNRQMMFLNFIGKTPESGWDKHAVMRWMDANLTPEKRESWELWKCLHRDIDEAEDPALVPFGAIDRQPETVPHRPSMLKKAWELYLKNSEKENQRLRHGNFSKRERAWFIYCAILLGLYLLEQIAVALNLL